MLKHSQSSCLYPIQEDNGLKSKSIELDLIYKIEENNAWNEKSKTGLDKKSNRDKKSRF